MKITAYFYDKYTSESIFIALILWFIYFIPFYLLYKSSNIMIPIILSLFLASFSSLFFANTLIEYLVFFLGFGIIFWSSIILSNITKKSLKLLILSILITIFCGYILYFMRNVIYHSSKIPNTEGYINFTNSGFWIWSIIQIIIIVYLIYYISKN